MPRYIEEWLEKYPCVKKFEKLLSRGRITPRTLDSYVTSVKEFCDLINIVDPEKALEYIRSIEEKEEWLDDLIEELREKVGDSRTVNIMRGIKKWLDMNRIDVEWRDVIIPSREAIVEDRAPTKEELRKILNFCNIRDRVYILVASSSGLRANTLRTLTFGDVNFDYPDVARIIVKRHYEIEGETFSSGRKISRKRTFYVTFITPEAKKSLLEYKKYREELGEKIIDKSPLFTSTRQEELGQFLSRKYLSVHWSRVLRRAHLTEKSKKWFVIHFHTLKKFAETQFINAGVKPSYREFWLGHSGAYLEVSYFRGEEEKHLEEYRKAIPYLTVIEPLAMTELELRKHGFLAKIKRELPEIYEEAEDLVLRAYTEEAYGDALNKLTRLMRERELKPLDVEHEYGEEISEDCQKIVSEAQLESYLAKGWKVQAVLPSGKVVIEK